MPMKVMRIGIKSTKKLLDDFVTTAKAIESGKHVPTRRGVYFTSLEAARNFLTPKRLELIRVIRKKKPSSIYALAQLTNRGFPTVLRDIELLAKHGLVHLSRSAKSPRRSIQPEVSYDAINLRITV
jgi:predicted transcriptional regulator